MDHGTSFQAPQTFDLTALAVHADRARRFRVRMNFAQISLGVALVALGAYFLLLPPPGAIPPFSTGPAIVIAIGALLVGVASWVRSSLGSSPRKLIVSGRGVVFDDIPRRKPLRLDWSDPHLKLDLYDMREIRRRNPKSQSKGYDFLIQVGGGPEAAVPEEAFNAIVVTARSQGLSLTAKSVPSGAGAPMLLTTIRRGS
jgi:hypothetical protein